MLETSGALSSPVYDWPHQQRVITPFPRNNTCILSFRNMSSVQFGSILLMRCLASNRLWRIKCKCSTAMCEHYQTMVTDGVCSRDSSSKCGLTIPVTAEVDVPNATNNKTASAVTEPKIMAAFFKVKMKFQTNLFLILFVSGHLE